MRWRKKKSKNKSFTPRTTAESANIIHVKSKFGEEFRRFGLKRTEGPQRFENFKALVRQLHGLVNMSFLIHYVDPSDSKFLPINNDYNFGQALKTAQRILRIIVLREEDIEHGMYKPPRSNLIGIFGQTPGKPRAPPISMPHDFRHLSAIIDVDIVPETHRRVRLLKHGRNNSLGFYIRDGTSVRVTPNGLEKQPGIFISRLVPGGLAESTGLFEINDEIVEVNRVNIAGMTLDQVTDMMVANSSNLIITLIPINQHTIPQDGHRSRTSPLYSNSHHTNYTNTSDELEQDDQDEIVDLTGVTLDDKTGSDGDGSSNGVDVLRFFSHIICNI